RRPAVRALWHQPERGRERPGLESRCGHCAAAPRAARAREQRPGTQGGDRVARLTEAAHERPPPRHAFTNLARPGPVSFLASACLLQTATEVCFTGVAEGAAGGSA